MSRLVAVIDVGSNSIKALVARSGDQSGSVVPVYEETLEVRISAGISGNPPALSENAIEAGVQAVSGLWKQCQQTGPLADAMIVATEAVRRAANRGQFSERVETATGNKPITLSGEEEADAIAQGILTDPSLDLGKDVFSAFDLGGGSLELIRFEHGSVTSRASLPLGSVRLAEEFFSNSRQPVPAHEREALVAHVRRTLSESGVPLGAPLVGCSGGLTTLRSIRASESGVDKRQASPVFSRPFLDALGERLMRSDYAQRIETDRLPASRADIFPAAILTFQTLLDVAGTDRILHSLHNLRYGLACRMLADRS
ncbi:MAG: Ppx/GppA phosphatase family protein [Opitutales bacterium]